MIFSIIIAVVSVVYAFLLIYYWQAWKVTKPFPVKDDTPFLTLSVIIPARNEEKNIGALLHALSQQTYPRHFFEVIVIDDHSTDNTARIVQEYKNVRLIRLTDDAINSYKKKAIATGIKHATKQWIVTTDADCIPPTSWLQTIASFQQTTSAVFIAAPVKIKSNSSILQTFQAMDFMVLQGITGAAVARKQLSMCNGANLAYPKTVFEEVDGFNGIDEIASGDDMLLMHKISKKFPGKLFYLKSQRALVETVPMLTWKSFFHQRIRWASKAMHYDDKRILPVLLLVYLFNLCFIALLIGGFWNTDYWAMMAILWMVKTAAELPLFIALRGFFGYGWSALLFFLYQPLHIIYTIISGLFGQFGKYEWKGRVVR